MKILALDQATQSGWAFGDGRSLETHTIDHGVFRMPKRPTMGERLTYFRNGLIERIDFFKPDLIAFEEPYWPHRSATEGFMPISWTKGLLSRVRSDSMTIGQAFAACAAEEDKKPVGQISAEMLQFLQMVKGHLIEVSAVNGIPTEGYVSASWRKTALGMGRAPPGSEKGILKKLMMQRARQLGYEPATEDEAEAIGILIHALHGEPAAKRAQGDLLEMAQEKLR